MTHGVEFTPGFACPQCVADPTSSKPPEFISEQARQLAISAAAKLARSEAWHKIAMRAVEIGELGHASRLGTLALQYERAADEQIAAAHAEEKDERLLEHDNRMAGVGRSH